MIAVITYDAPHRKTYDLLCGLKAHVTADITVLATPFVVRKKKHKPIYQHRPPVNTYVYPRTLALNLGYKYVSCMDYPCVAKRLDALKDLEMVLIAGAGILPLEIVEPFVVINSHPGWLPYMRGLDALKWAIKRRLIIGVTSHKVGVEADTGLLIAQEKIPVYPNDTFHALAYRQYEMEISMLIGATWRQRDTYFMDGDCGRGRVLDDAFPAYRRMGPEDEEKMMETFNEWTRK